MNNLETTDFQTYTPEEFSNNLFSLGISCHSDLIGKDVYYSKKSYGIHKVISWNVEKAEYLLELDGQRFYATPFLIHNI